MRKQTGRVIDYVMRAGIVLLLLFVSIRFSNFSVGFILPGNPLSQDCCTEHDVQTTNFDECACESCKAGSHCEHCLLHRYPSKTKAALAETITISQTVCTISNAQLTWNQGYLTNPHAPILPKNTDSQAPPFAVQFWPTIKLSC